MSFPSKRIRLHANCVTQRIREDVLTNALPHFLKPSDLRIEVALFTDDAEAIAAIDGLDQITCDIKLSDPRTGLSVMQKIVASGDLDPLLTLEDWQSGASDQAHAVFEFSAAESNVELDDDQVEFYIVLSALTTDGRQIPLANGLISIEESGASSDPPASVVEPTFYTAAQSDARYLLAADLSGKVNRSGDTMLGPLILDDDPTDPLGAVTKQLLESFTGDYVPLAGGTMTGPLVLSGAPTLNLHAATKLYADSKLSLAGGTLTGALTLSGAPTNNLHAATKLYVDDAVGDYLPLAGGTLTGALTLSGAPTTNLHAATKLYVDTKIADLVASSPSALDTLNELAAALGNDANFSTTVAASIGAKVAKAGDTMTGPLVLSGAPATGLHAATKTYVDTMVPLAGGVMTGALTLSGAPTNNLHAATKLYVDTADALKLNLAGGTLSGPLNFSGTGHAGITVNRLTSTQVTALGASTNGSIVYDTTLSAFRFREADTWKLLSSGGSGTNWLQGSADPDDGDGANGDYYLKEDGSIWFKTAGTWSEFVAPRLPLSGGTLTGQLAFAADLDPAISFETTGFNVWSFDADNSICIGRAGDAYLELTNDADCELGFGSLKVPTGEGVYVNGIKVITDQQPLISPPAGAAADTDVECRTAIGNILNLLEAHGLMASV